MTLFLFSTYSYWKNDIPGDDSSELSGVVVVRGECINGDFGIIILGTNNGWRSVMCFPSANISVLMSDPHSCLSSKSAYCISYQGRNKRKMNIIKMNLR